MSKYTQDQLLDTCSTAVQDGYSFLLSNSHRLGSPTENYHLDDSSIFFVIDKINPKTSKEYVKNTVAKYSSVTSDYEISRFPYRLWYYIKLCQKYNIDYQESSAVSYFRDMVKNWQNRNGQLPGEIDTTGRLRLLSIIDPDSSATVHAEEYYRNNWERSNNSREIALGILALSEINYDKHHDVMVNLASKLSEEQSHDGYFGRILYDPAEPDIPRVLPIETTGLSMRALARVEGYNEKIKKAEKWLVSQQNTNGSWVQNEHAHHRNIRHPLISTSYALLGLSVTMSGPKIVQSDKDWEIELEKQRKERLRPGFVQTYPSTNLYERKVEIRDRAEAMIVSAENELRISALMIDVLHEKIIQKIDQDLNVCILTRGGHAKGERKKLKKAVMKELVKRTNGNVKSTRLLHSRLLIADERELIVSSADLTRDQLHDEYNAGMYTEDKKAISDAIDYFDAIWEESEPVDIHS
ncbi:phospholipase D-like domain-containing protein [Natrialbaceae archaeon A-CW3]